MSLITVSARTYSADESRSVPVTVTGEHVTPNFAITPGIGLLVNGTHGLTGAYSLVHIPTGRTIVRDGWGRMDLRTLAARIEALAIDWAASDLDLDPSQGLQVVDLIHAAELAGDVTTPAAAVVTVWPR